MILSNFFSRLLKSLIAFAVVIGLLTGVLKFMDLSFTLESGRRILTEQLRSYTGREVNIDGEVELTLSFFPELLVKQIHIGNPEGFNKKNFISVSKVRVTVALLPLLTGKIHLSDISASQAIINLTNNKDGSNNWSFNTDDPQAKTDDKKTTNKNSGKSRLSIDEFQLSNIAINYNDKSRNQVIKTELDQLIINIKDPLKPHASISGKVQNYPYKISFKSDSLKKLHSGAPWLLHGTGHIAGSKTKLEASTQIIKHELKANLDIEIIKVNLGQLFAVLEIITAQDATTDKISINAKLQGSSLAELYEQAEINLNIGKGYWTLPAVEPNQQKILYFDNASAFTSWEKPLELHLNGIFSELPIKLYLKTNRLSDFFDEVKKLDLDLTFNIADIDSTLKGTLDLPVKRRLFNLDLSVQGKDLEKLNPIINTDFPPFNNFSLSGKLIGNEKGFIIKSANASIGDTKLQTSMTIETHAAKPLWNINLSSSQLQLKDFAFDDWNIKPTVTEQKKPSHQGQKQSQTVINERLIYEPLRRLETIVSNPKMHINLNLKVDKLLSGEEHLGKAQFELHLIDNEFSLDNADIEIPGGRIRLSLSLKNDNNGASGHAVININKLDYGIATRLFIPDSEVSGKASLRVDLELGGSDFTDLFNSATGQFDIATWPKNTKSVKVLNLWSTNLYLVLLPELQKKESKVNCFVGLMSLNDGIMKEDLFVVDTTKLWIKGNFTVDFKQERFKLSLFPRSKTARLFSLQTPIRVDGSFSDVNLTVKPRDLIGTYFSFVTSPLTVPIKRVLGGKIPDDASEICEQLFDRQYVEKLKAELEQEQQQEVIDMLDAD